MIPLMTTVHPHPHLKRIEKLKEKQEKIKEKRVHLQKLLNQQQLMFNKQALAQQILKLKTQ
jgi:hypothetical protein